MDKTQTVTLRSFAKELDADIAKQHLESEKIVAFVVKDDYGGIQPFLQALQGVFLKVNEKDAQKAEQILKLRKI